MKNSKKASKPIPTEMEIVTASEQGSLLDFLYDKSLNRSKENYSDFCELLTQLHNSKKIDLLEAFSSLKNDGEQSRDFWIQQDLFVTLAPQLEVHIDTFMEVIEHLVDQGGNDLTAKWQCVRCQTKTEPSQSCHVQ